MTSRYIPIYLFAAFIIILLVVLTFVAKDENQKIYRPGTLEKYLLQKAARIHQHIRQTLRGLAQRPALPAHIPETRIDGDTLTFHGALSHNGILDSDWFRRQSGGALPGALQGKMLPPDPERLRRLAARLDALPNVSAVYEEYPAETHGSIMKLSFQAALVLAAEP